jgi:hypothetical protein
MTLWTRPDQLGEIGLEVLLSKGDIPGVNRPLRVEVPGAEGARGRRTGGKRCRHLRCFGLASARGEHENAGEGGQARGRRVGPQGDEG